MTMRYGLKLAQRAPIDDYRAVWQVADDGGFDSCWLMDHFATIGGDPDGDIFEAWSMLGAMAVATSRTRIGCMVTGNTYRHPGVLAKCAATVDHLSGGRLDFGIGAAWAELEHSMFGLQFGTAGERLDRLEEACQVIRSLWTEPRTTFAGEHYTITDAIAIPKPVQERLPIWIGGNGRKRTLRIVARYGDVWNAVHGDPELVAELSGVLDAHCAEVGRDPAEIRRTIQVRPPASDSPADKDEFLRLMDAYAAVGVSEVVISAMTPGAVASVERTATLLPRLREVG